MPVNADLRSKLVELAPYGHVATRSWLMDKGIKLHSIDNLVKSNQLVETLNDGKSIWAEKNLAQI